MAFLSHFSLQNDSFPTEKFTEEVFFTFYKHLVVRKEVFKIFQKL